MAHRDWIAAEFSKGVEAEESSSEEAKARAESPPDPALGVLYGEIAEADARHKAVVETVAIRYGYTPSRGLRGGIGEALGRLKDKVAERVSGSTPQERIGHDLAMKANSIHWYTAWIHAFQAIGDDESARELAAVLTEDQAHRDALQTGLNLMVERGALDPEPAKAES